jgi:hypothetical protein
LSLSDGSTDMADVLISKNHEEFDSQRTNLHPVADGMHSRLGKTFSEMITRLIRPE